MAELLGKNATKIANKGLADKGEYNGHVKVFYDEIVLPAAVVAATDTIKLNGKLPKGARVLDAVVKSPSLGTTGIFSLGHAAGKNMDGSAIPADPDAFIVAADAGGQAVLAKGDGAGIGKRFEGDLDIMLTATEATTTAEGMLVQAWLTYIVD